MFLIISLRSVHVLQYVLLFSTTKDEVNFWWTPGGMIAHLPENCDIHVLGYKEVGVPWSKHYYE